VDHRAGLDDAEKRIFLTLLGLELRPLGRPSRSQLLYRLRYYVIKIIFTLIFIMIVITVINSENICNM
jgi:hypothetical protein